jgi:hypothetical protein
MNDDSQMRWMLEYAAGNGLMTPLDQTLADQIFDIISN